VGGGGGRLKDGDARNVVFTPQRRRAHARGVSTRPPRVYHSHKVSPSDRPTDGTITPRRRRIAATGNSPPPH